MTLLISNGGCHGAGTTAAAYTHALVDAALAGDVLVVCGNSNGTHAANGMSVKDSVNNVNFTTILEQDLSGASSRWLQSFIFQTPVDLAAGTTITFTPYALNSASTFALAILRGTTATVDTGPLGQSPASGTTSLTSALSPVPKAGSLVLSFGSFSSGTLSVSSPVTLATTDATGPSTAVGYVLSADGASGYANTWTSTVTNSNANVIVAYLPAAGSSRGATPTPLHPGRGPSRLARFRQRAAAYIFAVFPPATEALGTGAALDATVAIAVNPSAPTGTGTANNPSVTIAVNAGAATGTGTAYDAAVLTATASSGAVANARHPGRGPSLTRFFRNPNAGFTTAVSGDVSVNAAAALAVGTAYNGAVSIASNAANGAGTGTASDASASVSGSAGAATGSTTVGSAAAVQANAAAALGSGSSAATAALAVNATSALGTGTAFDAAIVTVENPALGVAQNARHPGRGPSLARFIERPGGFSAGQTGADPGLAVGTAPAPTVAVTANSGAAAAAGTAYDATIRITVGGAAATGTGTASGAGVMLGAAPLAALASAAAQQAALALRANATAGSGAGAAYDVASGFKLLVDAQPALGRALPNGLWTARPLTGVTGRPGAGTTSRPSSGTTARGNTGTTSRPDTGRTDDPG